MRNIIKYFYNIDFNDLIEKNDYYILDNYILKEVNIVDLELYNYLLLNNIYVDKIIKNINESIISNINNKQYILMEITNKKEIVLDDIISYDNYIKTNKNIEWDKLWESKVDYYENNIVNIKDKELLRIYPYYIGLSEIAIRIYKEIGDNRSISLNHKRLYNDIEFYNITNLIVDYKVRDIAEYIKKEFFNNKKIDISFIFNIGLTSDDYALLFDRLLFPTYFYDCIYNNDKLNKYTSKILEYEEYLNYIYYEISKIVKLPCIEWLIKKV